MASPIVRISDGWFTRRHAMSVTCNRPSTPPRSTNAPYSVMFFTTPSTSWPSARLPMTSARCSARDSSRIARRDTTMLPRRRSIFKIWNGCLMFINGPASRTGRTSTCDPGKNATAPPKSTVKPPLTRPKIAPSTRSSLACAFSRRSHASSRRAISRDTTASPLTFSAARK